MAVTARTYVYYRTTASHQTLPTKWNICLIKSYFGQTNLSYIISGEVIEFTKEKQMSWQFSEALIHMSVLLDQHVILCLLQQIALPHNQTKMSQSNWLVAFKLVSIATVVLHIIDTSLSNVNKYFSQWGMKPHYLFTNCMMLSLYSTQSILT